MNATALDQSRLDVVAKTRSNIFNWRGQFTPQFVDYILDSFAISGQQILDPFCGSGTVLLESATKGLPAVGCEINPAAYAMTKFVSLANDNPGSRLESFARVEEAILRLAGNYHDMPLFETESDFRQRYKNLLDFAGDLFTAVERKRDLLIALIILIRAESSGRGDLIPVVRRACASVKSDLTNLPHVKPSIRAELCDAREVHRILRASTDLILTSPPYINVFNYHQNHRALLEVLGFDLLKVAESEIGSNRKNRANRFRTVVQYALDMESCLSSFALSLKTGGLLILVVGHQSQVRGIPFSNSGILREIAQTVGCYTSEGERHRVFLNRFGQSIREDIIILRYDGRQPTDGSARRIAETHLERALETADGDPHDDIVEALSDLPSIMPSQMFNRKGIL
jgi:SAM-dependent methyltransferase